MGGGAGKQVKEKEDFEIYRKYDFLFKLGAGSISQVHHAQAKSSSQDVAIKCVVKKESEIEDEAAQKRDIYQEAKVMKQMEHPNICRLYEVFEDIYLVYFVLELCVGGGLFDKLEKDIVLEEHDASRFAREVCSAVAFIHERGIIHRDLKPENWLLLDYSAHSAVKLVNFRLALPIKPEQRLAQPCGTLHYVAPEVLRSSYNMPADVWTLGVVIFLMMYATYPFDGESCTAVMQAIVASEPDWSDSCYTLSADAKDCLKNMLIKEPAQRFTAAQALNHAWLRQFPSEKTPAEAKANSESLAKLQGIRQSQINPHMTGVPSDAKGDRPKIKGAPGGTRRTSVMVTQELVMRSRTADLAGASEPVKPMPPIAQKGSTGTESEQTNAET